MEPLFDGRYEQLKLIGRGGFSEVWEVRDTQTGVIQALKIYSPEQGVSDEGIEMLVREFALLCDANHPNLLRPSYFAICKDMSDSRHKNLPYLVLPFCRKGNISKMVGKFSERDSWILIRDTANALNYLHTMDPPIIHQDIKPENILIGNDGSYQLTDFGVSIQARSTMSKAVNTDEQVKSAGTLAYMAPERFSRNNMAILANDIYSLGVMVFELIAGYLPFGNTGGLLQLKGAEIPELPGDFSPLLKKTIDECLQNDPWKRPIASKLAETADMALGKTPTIVGQVGGQGLADHPTGTQATGKGPGRQIFKYAAIIMSVFVLGIAALFGYNKLTEDSPEEPPVIQATQPTVTESVSPQTTVEESPTEIPVEEPVVEMTESKEEKGADQTIEIKLEPKPVVKTEQPTEKKVETKVEPKAEQKVESRTEKGLDLGYATWKGGSQNGKPHGYGTMTFHSNHRIDSRDPQGNMAQSGDRVEGNYNNGHLEYGTWYKSNGEKEQLFIGQ